MRRPRKVAPNPSEHERLLADHSAELKRRPDANTRLARTLHALNAFTEQFGSFADEHSTL